jgi:hypothetical protein
MILGSQITYSENEGSTFPTRGFWPTINKLVIKISIDTYGKKKFHLLAEHNQIDSRHCVKPIQWIDACIPGLLYQENQPNS